MKVGEIRFAILRKGGKLDYGPAWRKMPWLTHKEAAVYAGAEDAVVPVTVRMVVMNAG